MPRPTKFRRVEFFPKDTYFVPLGKAKCELEEVILKVEELEAMRLKDIEGLNQEECAERMQVSRQTFQNIIDEARRKVAVALSEGKAININGGNYITSKCKFKCIECGTIYPIQYEQDKKSCPSCGSQEVMCGRKAEFCKSWCRGNGNDKNYDSNRGQTR
ncbi:DUF134 domain-containing protein [Anaeromicropila populeti]|uniref:UPF0251 protein SAMN05661086_02205 n=1 Tax=Anaeromicropila populeti TaxID=37658 RepID=A0A1I6K5M3_9FIRM|nr:DUF134 domain-containing protein [Anaeromicropila populeti]SFR86444.1 Predicted DNA-binding protein, UPF0251 family [Anaeromicropila populeti]